MWCRQLAACAFLQYLRHVTINCPNPHDPPGGLFYASSPAILSVPVSRELLGGRANNQDNHQPDSATPPRYWCLDRLGSLRGVRRWNSGLPRGDPRPHRTRTLRRRPRPQYDTSPDILRSRDRSHNIRILLRRGLQFRVGSWCLYRLTVRHRIRNRRRNLRALRSPPHILPPEQPWSHATPDSLRHIDIFGPGQCVPPPVWQRWILALLLRHRSTPLHRLPRCYTSRTLRDSILPGTRENRSS